MAAETVIVCGGAGYIGSHTARQLAMTGRSVIVVDDLSTGSARAVQWGPLERGDIGDQAFMTTVFDRYRPTAVLHFAALIDVGASVADPAHYYETNLVKSLRLFDAMRAAGIPKLIFSSTAAVYGACDQDTPIDETQACRPINPYGETKLADEHALRSYPKYQAIRHVALRYFNAAGADHAQALGPDYRKVANLIPRAVAAAFGDSPPLQLYGDDYETPDGTCIRDYIHVNDLARAHVAALDYLNGGGTSTVCNLGTGQGYSVREVLTTIAMAVGRPVPHTIVPRRAGDPSRLTAAKQRAEMLLGWQPQHDLHDIVSSAVAWHSKQHAIDTAVIDPVTNCL